MVLLGQYFGSNPQRYSNMIHHNNFLHVASARQEMRHSLWIETNRIQWWLAGRMISLPLPSWHTRSISLPVQFGTKHCPVTKEHKAWGIFSKNPLQFSSMLVKLQKRSQQGDFEHSYQSTATILLVCLSTLLPGVIGIIVRLALGTNWASSWRARAVSLKGHVSGGAPGDTEHASMLERQLAW